MGGEFLTDFKSSNGIEISWLVQVLSNFNWFRGSPPGGWQMGGWRWGWVWGCGGVPCTHACTCMHTHTHMHVKHAKHGCLHAGGHLQFYTCVCVCVLMCTCMCMHVGAPPMPPDTPPPTCPLPRATGSPKHQISISLELIEIIRFCLKILYLWTLLNSYRL